jgi:hypothetical protein
VRSRGFRDQLREQPLLLAFAGVSLVGWTLYGFAVGAPATVAYLVTVLVAIVLVMLLDQRVGFSSWILWALAGWGFAHMAGGLVSVGDGVLYNAELAGTVIHYDRVVHAIGFGVAAVASWETFAAIQPRVGITPGTAVLVALMGMGVGAANEVIEFAGQPPVRVERRRLREHRVGPRREPARLHRRRDVAVRRATLEGAHATGDLEHRVGVLLRIDHDRPGGADLRLPIAVDLLVRPTAGQRALHVAHHLGAMPDRVRRDEESTSFPVDRQPEGADQTPRGVIARARDQQEANGALRQRVGRDDPLAQRCERRLDVLHVLVTRPHVPPRFDRCARSDASWRLEGAALSGGLNLSVARVPAT